MVSFVDVGGKELEDLPGSVFTEVVRSSESFVGTRFDFSEVVGGFVCSVDVA